MNFTDGELGLAMACNNRLRQNTAQAQSIIDAKNREITRLLRRIRQLEHENATLIAERTKRHQQKIAAYLASH